MKHFKSAIFLIAILLISNLSAAAQESELRVIDEVIAQVNDSVVTLSRVNREIDSIIETMQQEGKTAEEARAEVEGKRWELIANIINEELLLQRAKDYGFESEIEAQVNQMFLQKMRELNLRSLDELYGAMREQGVNPDDIRDLWRKQYAKDFVLQNDVDAKVFGGLKPREVKAYFDANKAQFTKPETVTLSEIFLSFAGNDPVAVRARAKELAEQARGGANFADLAVQHSDRQDAATTKGVAGTFNIVDMDPKYADGLKALSVGGILEPFELDNVGMQIIRLDAREKASSESFFDEQAVRRAMALERIPEARRLYFVKLRQDSYIKINEKYRPQVAPILYAEERKTAGEAEPGR